MSQAIPPSTRRLWLWLIPLAAFVVFAVFLGTRLGNDPTVQVNQQLGRPLPAFSLPDLADGQLRTPQDLPKTPYILNVWGSWCPSCKIEHPLLLELAAQRVTLIGINYKDEATDALAYLNTYQNPFAMNIQDIEGSLGIDLGLTGAPESFVIDQKGRIRQHIVGVIDTNNWQGQIKPCLDALQTEGADGGETACR
jgi:cytochrome c biogenesis protein CcmG/thiol:disulfide interchange protein DsbE